MQVSISQIVCVFALFVTFIQSVLSTDDYMSIQHREGYANRIQRSQSNHLNGLYRIESSFNHLVLTALPAKVSLGPVVLRHWNDGANQLWQITKFDTSKGHNIKPLDHEFNIVTSTVKDNSHAYNAWEFIKQPKPNQFSIMNTLNKKCLQTANLKERVRFENCDVANVKQSWTMTNLD